MTTVINSQTKPRTPMNPIDILHNDTAKLYTHIHPVLVLSAYAYQFSAIVADPVPALTSALVPLSILQIAYVAICLPPTGSSGNLTIQQEKRKPGEKKKPAPGKVEVGINVKIIVRICSPPQTIVVFSTTVIHTYQHYSPLFSPSFSHSSSQRLYSPQPSSSSAHP